MNSKVDDCQKSAIRFWQDNGGSDYELDLLAQLLRDQRRVERDRCLRSAQGFLKSVVERAKTDDYGEGCRDTARLMVKRLEGLKDQSELE